jgi:asparagine synthase (glutamine-hydrolysing)
MCGIVGYIKSGDPPCPMSELLATIAHRGPDGEGAHEETSGQWRVVLGHRRLSIIDLATGAQPMANAAEDVVITYNGEVYNYRELRAELESHGHSFTTKSDTEVVLRHYEAKGDRGLADLSGMFAFAVWDRRARSLLLARDRAGIKPLYYASLPCGGIAFGSELTAVLTATGARSLDAAGVVSYFFSDYAHGAHTFAKGVLALPPGHSVVWQDGELSAPKPFWSVPSPAKAPRASDADLADELWRLLDDAVRQRLVADVPLGVNLSGGIDSSIVAALAARHAPSRLKAFTIAFTDATHDESVYARQVADEVGVDYVEERLTEENVLSVADAALSALDEPLADGSYLPTYLLSRLASRHVKVVLGGDGGDELWAGYPTYRAHRYARAYELLPSFVRQNVQRAIDRLPVDDRYQSLEWKLRRFAGRWDDDPIRRHLRWMSSLDLADLADAVPSSRTLPPPTLRASLPVTDDVLHRLLALDFTTYMVDSVLTKVDRASMAHGLEARPAILDDKVIDFAFALPSSFKLRHGTTKFLLKKAAKHALPRQIIDRRKKGFGIPLARWLRGPLAPRIQDIVASSPAWDTGLLSRDAFTRYMTEHQSQRADRSKPLWALYVLDHWLRRRSKLVRLGDVTG